MFKSQVEVQPDFLPRVFDTGLYEMVIDMAYLDQSKPKTAPDGTPDGEAYSLTVVLKSKDGREHKETLWITGGKAKGQLTYYLDKEGNKQNLPGFAVANALVMLSLGKELGDLTPEEKSVMIYDFTAKKELPQQKQVYTELIGQKVDIGLQKIKTFKQKKNDATGKYENTTDTREFNEIQHVVKADTKQTMYEFATGTDAKYIDSWVERNAGKTRDKTAPKKGAGAATSGSEAPAGGKPLFGN